MVIGTGNIWRFPPGLCRQQWRQISHQLLPRLAPVIAVAMVAIGWDPEHWWYPFASENLGTVISPFVIALILCFILQKKAAEKVDAGPMIKTVDKAGCHRNDDPLPGRLCRRIFLLRHEGRQAEVTLLPGAIQKTGLRRQQAVLLRSSAVSRQPEAVRVSGASGPCGSRRSGWQR